MANERRPRRRKQPENNLPSSEGSDEWDDDLLDKDMDDDAIESGAGAGAEPMLAEPEETTAGIPAAEETLAPEQLEGAVRTKDGLIRVKEGAKKKDPAGTKDKEPWLKSLGLMDYIGLAASLAIFIGLASMLLTWMYGQEWGDGANRPLPEPDLPAAGKFFKITSAESYWRRRVDSDRAPTSQVILPETIIEVEAVGERGTLSVFFRDPAGKMSADAGNIRLEGGKLSLNANEGKQEGSNRFIFTATKGFTFEPEFRSYISMEQKNLWSIEIVESENRGDKKTNRLAYFEIANDSRTKEKAADAGE